MIRLTQTAPGGGCSCKVEPGALERMLAAAGGGIGMSLGPAGVAGHELVCGTEHGDDAAVVRIDGRRGIVATTDFFPPVVDDPFDWGRIAAANALSDVYAMGGDPLVALSLLAWPVDDLPEELAVEVLRGGQAVAAEAVCPIAGGHSIVDTTPKYGLAVTGTVDLEHLLRNDAAEPGDPLTLTKPLGVGVLNSRHKATGERFGEAVASMAALNRDAARAAVAAGATAATDVTGFGLLGHLFKMARASGVRAALDAAAVPYLDAARQAVADGFVPGGTVRNLAWVRPHLEASVGHEELLLLADAQTSGGLLVAGEVPGWPVVGEVLAAGTAGDPTLVVR
ncbi:MAG: selenide, water dikinase SelD [Acidimicrobiales bacterium]